MTGSAMKVAGYLVWALIVFAPAGGWAAPRIAEDDLDAEFWFDLGPREIDVSRYPEIQKRNYFIFAHSCSQCHTLARPISAPIVERKDWQRFVERMHVRSKTWQNTVMTRIGEEAIVDFLVYDAGVRKRAKKAAYEKERARLEELYKYVLIERDRRQKEESRQNLPEPAPYVGDKPQP